MKLRTKCFFLIYLLFFTVVLHAQSSWQWGKRGGSGGSGTGAIADEQVIDMATDQNGNVYVLAINNPGMANVDGHMGVTVRDRLTLASWSCSGTFRWMKNVGGASVTLGRALEVDTVGGVYVTGQTNSTNSLAYTYFDRDTNLGNTAKRIFLVKYDTAGTLKWLKMPQPDTVTATSEGRPLDLAVAPNGDLFWYAYLTPGNYDGNAFMVTSAGYYIVKFNAAGTYQRIMSLDMITTDGGNPGNLNGITNAEMSRFSRDHKSGRFYLTGQFVPTYGTLSFGSTTINSTGAIGALPLYLAVFDANANNLWTKQSSPSLYASNRNCRAVVDGDGHIYIGGDMYSGSAFAGRSFMNNLSVHTFPFVISLDSNGNARWASNGLPKDGASAAYSITYVNNTVGLAGYYGGLLKWGIDSLTAPLTMSGTGYIFLVQLNAVTGSVTGMNYIASQSSLDNFATDVTADKKGNFFVGGKFDYRLFPGPDTIASVGGYYDWFVAKFGNSNCNCTLPVASFTKNTAGRIINLRYSGISAGIDSVVWTYGNGVSVTKTGSAISTAFNYTYPANGNYIVCMTVFNSCGRNQSCQSITIDNVGVNSILSGNINIYPNPVTDHLTIEGAKPGTSAYLQDMFGRMVMDKMTLSAMQFISLAHIASGHYILTLTGTDGQQEIRRIVKQ